MTVRLARVTAALIHMHWNASEAPAQGRGGLNHIEHDQGRTWKLIWMGGRVQGLRSRVVVIRSTLAPSVCSWHVQH